jgi:cytochrome b involved in lipid metabolism
MAKTVTTENINERPVLTDTMIDNQSLEMKAILDAQPKKTVRLMKNTNYDSVPVSINGYVYLIKCGEEVEVPAEVYNILVNSGYY